MICFLLKYVVFGEVWCCCSTAFVQTMSNNLNSGAWRMKPVPPGQIYNT